MATPKTSGGDFRASRFAQKEEFSGWFPKIDEDENKRASRSWKSRQSQTLMLQITIVVAVLVANFTLTMMAVGRFPSTNGVGVIYEGDCGTVAELDQWLHLLINLLSTGMLAASKYCMQLQAAPTRADVDRAHKNNKWLDIGVPSVRNLWFIGHWRRFSWVLLAYNSAVFQSLSSHDYTIAVVKDSFLDNCAWSLETAERNRHGDPGWNETRVNPPELNYTQVIQGIQRDALSLPYVKKNVTECFDLYADYFAPQGNAVILVKNASIQTPTNDSLLMYVSVVPRWDDWGKNLWALGNGTGRLVALSPPEPVTEWFLGPPRYEVSSCLVQPLRTTASSCRFEFSPQIMIIICSLNCTKALVMLSIFFLRSWQDPKRQESQKEREPDTTTENMCLAPKDDFLPTRTWKNRLVKKDPSPSQDARECLVVLLIAAILLGLAFHSLNLRGISYAMHSLWAMGFGKLQPYAYIVTVLPRSDPAGLIANVLLANLLQLILSILYIFYNAMLSTFLVQREFSLLYKGRKPVKPLRSLSLARITAVRPDGTYDVQNSFSSCGFSPIAIFITLLVALTLILAILLMGFRSYDGTMRVVATNSRAISAACHVLPEDRPSGYLLPVTWGVVEMKGGIGKCTFTTASRETGLPEPGHLYR
ncbi:hypothetical protein QBC46DRAFT_459091 [Diplogelasinospora grovesii]|uniref:DUF6536 domain-containing protein n=1 Tax=Diplogelasinospora grovesii TaxID=303347 RepID=A0AAN6N6X9_9PEZI|nr:hypothetical protein QBC46DRAFT_459091 [Diplogelasinospora grovesii]